MTSRRLRRAGLAALLLVGGAALSRVAADDARLPVPDAAARGPVVAQIKKEFKDDLHAKDADVRRKLVRTLLDRAADAKRDAVERYVLLDQAEALAEEVRDVRLALDAAHRAAEAFQVQGPTRALASIDAVTRGAKEAALLADGAGACVDVAGEALVANDAATAGKAVASAKTLATAAKVGGLAARAGELVELIGAFRKESAAADAAATTLTATPDDPAAHESVGRFLCFGRADWAGGLDHLAKGADAQLKDVAAKELAKSEAVADRTAVADAWWQTAQKEKDPLAKARMLARAAAVYDATPEDAPAERRALVKTRLDTLTWFAWNRGVALTKDFSKFGADQLALATIRAFIAQKKIDRTASEWRSKLPKFPETTFSAGVEYLWTLETNVGVITLRLFPDTAPNHVANCIYLTELGFYDGLIFHRVIPGFMAQGGAVNKDGNGGPGYSFDGEFASLRKVDKAGLLAMANAGPATDNCQFFITFAAAEHLNGKHTVYGEVVSGMDVVKKLEAQGSPEGKTKSELQIVSARISVR